MKKTKEWLETLDKKYRDKALKNMTKADDLHSTLAGAVSNGFVWDDTPEGHDFWNGVFRELMWGKKFEVTDKTKSDEIVKWKSVHDSTIVYDRYYHIYAKDELREEILRLKPEFTIIDEYIEKGNWVISLKK